VFASPVFSGGIKRPAPYVTQTAVTRPCQTTVEDYFSDEDSEDDIIAQESMESWEDSMDLSDEGEDEEGMEVFLDDDITEDDLVRVLKEHFGDQWQKELHDLHIILHYICSYIILTSF